MLSGGRRQPGDVTLEESAENLEGRRDVVKQRGETCPSEASCSPCCFVLKQLFGLLDFPDSGTEYRTAVPFSQNTYWGTSAPLPDVFGKKYYCAK